MPEPIEKIVRERVQPDWNSKRQSEIWQKIENRRNRFSRRGITWAIALPAAAAILFALLRGQPTPEDPLEKMASRSSKTSEAVVPLAVPTPKATASVSPAIVNDILADGSTYKTFRIGEDVDLRAAAILENTEDEIVIELVQVPSQGEVTASVFRVSERARSFSIIASLSSGEVRVEAEANTIFEALRKGETIAVSVKRGKATVVWVSGASILTAGDSEIFPLLSPHKLVPGLKKKSQAHSAKKFHARAWKGLAEQDNYDQAYEALKPNNGPKPVVRDNVNELMLAADVAQLSGHPAEALGYLQRVVSNFPADPRASLAAFTAGKVQLHKLGQPRQAAKLFKKTRELDPSSSLVQDALAREVESWSRAGEITTAQGLAKQYLTRYPNGRRAKAVRRFSELD